MAGKGSEIGRKKKKKRKEKGRSGRDIFKYSVTWYSSRSLLT
jgi:hypothetical protein